MENNSKTYRFRRGLTVLLVIFAIVLFMILGIHSLLKSDWLFDKIRDIAIEQADELIHGQIQIGEIRGDLRHGFVIYDLNILDHHSEMVLRSDSIEVKYKWLNLIRSPHQIENLNLYGFYGNLSQDADSVWNVQKLVKETLDPDDPANDAIEWDLKQIQISGFQLDIYSEALLPDSSLSIQNLNALMAAGYQDNGFYGSIYALEFQLDEARLPQNIGIELSAKMDDGTITLESLLLDTGRSYLKATAALERDQHLYAEIDLSPISREDLIMYMDDLPLHKNLNLSLSAGGRMDDLNINLFAQADGLERLELFTNLSIDEPFLLRSFSMNVDHLNLPILTGEEGWPIIESIILDGNGTVFLENPEESQWEGNVEFATLKMPELQLDYFSSELVWEKDNLNLDASLGYQNQSITIAGSLHQLFDERPNWNLMIESEDVNLAVWLDQPEMDSGFRFLTAIKGIGLSAEDFNIDADIQITDGRFGNQRFEQIAFDGHISPDLIRGGLTAQIERSRLTADVRIYDWPDVPNYEFTTELQALNLAEFDGFEEFPTFINGAFIGYGTGIEPENLELFATADLDSSIVNGEVIERFTAQFRVENSYLHIDEGLIRSPIADAALSLRQHLTDVMDPENRFNFEASIKDLTVLAPLFGVDTLEAEGNITGSLSRNPAGILAFNGRSNLQNVKMDTLFSSDIITVNLDILLKDEQETEIHVNLISPNVLDLEIQDLNLVAFATIIEEETTGNVNVKLTNGEESSLQHEGDFYFKQGDIRLTTTGLTFQTGQRILLLTKPFDLTYSENVLRSDTLSIATESLDSYLNLWIPHLDTLHQQVGLDASNLNLGLLLSTVMEEKYFDGFLSGNIELKNSPEDLIINASGSLREFGMNDGEMDSLSFNIRLADEWLDANLHSWHHEQKLIQSSIRVPYLPGDPLTFEEQFFEREVAGNFQLLESDLRYWLSFLPEGIPEQTDGMLSIQMDLSGIAGSPELVGHLKLDNGLFSGVRFDQLAVNLDYMHADSETLVSGNLIRDQRRVMDFDTRVPFLVDLKRAEIILPSDEDEIYATFRSEDLDLAMFNNYLDPDLVRNVTGRLDANLNISGKLADVEINGTLNLTRGAMRIVPAGINLTEIRSSVLFEPNRINLQQFTVRSGPGTFRATGTVGLQGFQPGNIDVEMVANQFRVANTSEYNAIVNSRSGISGNIDNPRLTGSLTFLNGFVNLQNFGERAIEAVMLDDEEEGDPFPFYDNLAMEMDVRFTRQFFIRNRQYLDMEIELGGQVDLLKEKNEDIQMFGTLEGIRGYARPLGKNFELDEAVLSFSGPIDDPQLNIITKHEPPQAAGVIIFYVIDGTLQSPQFRFDSSPELELQDIVSYTLFGKPFYDLESWEQVVAGSGSSPSAADYALDVLLDRVEMLASQRLGIDVVQIDNTRSGSSNTTSIKTGWYLNRRTFFAILNEVGGSRPKTLFLLEYLLTDNLELIIMQGDDSREGVDLRWKRDY